jgi:hypothetical protein
VGLGVGEDIRHRLRSKVSLLGRAQLRGPEGPPNHPAPAYFRFSLGRPWLGVYFVSLPLLYFTRGGGMALTLRGLDE